MTAADVTGDDIIRILGMIPHAEGGHYREMYRDTHSEGSRGVMSSIYFLLRAGERSHWHRFDATETWCYHAGAPLELTIWTEGQSIEKHRIGSNVLAGEKPQLTVPTGTWHAAETLGDWTLVGCVVAPAFEFSGFELAPKGWSPDVRTSD